MVWGCVLLTDHDDVLATYITWGCMSELTRDFYSEESLPQRYPPRLPALQSSNGNKLLWSRREFSREFLALVAGGTGSPSDVNVFEYQGYRDQLANSGRD